MSAIVNVVARERRGLDRERLRLGRALERHFALRHGPIFDAVDRLARDAIEDEEQAELADHADGGNRLAALPHVDRAPAATRVAVPDVVTNQLEVPEVLAGVRVGRYEAAC